MKLNEKEQYRYIISPGIADINSNVRVIPGFPPVNPERQTESKLLSEVNITFSVGKIQTIHSRSVMSFGNLYWEPESDTLLREYHFPFHMRAKLELKGLNDSPTVRVDKNYNRFGKLRMNDFYPAGIHVRDILLSELIKAGYLPLHSTAFAAHNQGILVIGPPGIGKTLVLVQAMHYGYQYVADDLAIADSNCLMYPCTGISSLAYETSIDKLYDQSVKGKCGIRLRRLLSKVVPPVDYVLPPPYIDINLFASDTKISGETQVSKIFILARGNNSVKKLPANESFKMILRMNRLEFSYYGNKILQAYSMLNTRFDLQELMRIEEKMIKELVERADCFLCVASKPDDYFNLIQRSM